MYGTGPNDINRCQCARGWSGVSCIQCTSDAACKKRHQDMFPNDTNFTAICDQSWLPHYERYYTCYPLDPHMVDLIGNTTTMSCTELQDDKGGVQNGTCTFQGWTLDSKRHRPGFMVQSIDCVFHNCTRNLLPGGHVEAICRTTKCRCGEADKCDDPEVRYIVNNMKTRATVVCNNNTKKCEVNQAEFPGSIDLTCFSAECVQSLRNYEVPPYNYFLYYLSGGIFGGIALITVFIGILLVIFDLLFKYHSTKEWKSLNTEVMGSEFEFKNIVYKLKVFEKGRWVERTILKNLSHKVKGGSLLALMGPSGAGKTTLLDILAKRNKSGSLTGEILVDGIDLRNSFKRMTGYVFQDDILMSTQTVRECLMFSANMRLPSCVTHEEKVERVNKAMEDLGITHIADRPIGNESSRGISGGEKRRVSIGMELVISPHVLFLDEPTSGLDAYNAYTVVKCLTNLAKKGRTIIFSIHQPRSNIFSQFDEIILINGGLIVYSGSAEGSIDYFTKLGYEFPKNTNPADYLIDLLTMNPQSQNTGMVSTVNTSYGTGTVTSFKEPNLDEEVAEIENSPFLSKSTPPMTPFATSFLDQFYYLSKRAFANFLRNFYLMPAHFGSAVVLGLILGGLYWKLGINLAACQNRIGVIFFFCSVLGFGSMSSLEIFVSERVIYTRERANGYYRSLAYFLSKILFDIIPLRVIPPVIMGSICYWMIGLRGGITHFLWFLLIMVLFNVVSGGLCLSIASIAPSVASANVIAIASLLTNSLLSGFLVNKGSLPSWLSWIFYLSYWNYAFEALLINEFLGITIIIDPREGRVYPGPGTFILDLFKMEVDRFYIDIAALMCFGIFFIILSGIMVKYFVKEKR